MRCHLSEHERYQIQHLRNALSVDQIARRLGRHRSSIYRELQRCAPGKYCAIQAQSHRRGCAARSCANAPRHDTRIWRRVRRRLARQWSPQQIAGRARLRGQPCPSWQAIYAWCLRHWPHRQQRPLRRAHKRAGHSGWARQARPIGQRPPHVALRQQLGHWEMDTMVGLRGGYKPRLLVAVERASRFTRLRLAPNALPATMAREAQRALLQNPAWPVHSVTVDRGSEFAHLPALLGERLYVCDPRQPNQRGTNENTIGLIRQYFPKGQPLGLQTPQSIARIEHLLNHRPRACLGFKTPAEVLSDMRRRCRDSS
jgi:transposase, IS30 family